ncbi:MAG: ScpA family protein [Patescibacteria group bacterium]
MIEVTTEKFSGPLGLLLSLIESEELDITEVSLAKIADEYVAYIRAAQDINPEELADFLVIAAKLLFIKSKALLPYLYSGEEEEEINDLERQLRMYKEFVAASQTVKALIGEGRWLYLPPFAGAKSRRGQFNLPVFSPPAKLTPILLHEKFLLLLARLEKQREEVLPEATLEPKINIEDRIAAIKQLLVDKIKVNFSRLLASAATKTEVIVSFLAVLELAKQKELCFEQDELFSEIRISRQID